MINAKKDEHVNACTATECGHFKALGGSVHDRRPIAQFPLEGFIVVKRKHAKKKERTNITDWVNSFTGGDAIIDCKDSEGNNKTYAFSNGKVMGGKDGRSGQIVKTGSLKCFVDPEPGSLRTTTSAYMGTTGFEHVCARVCAHRFERLRSCVAC